MALASLDPCRSPLTTAGGATESDPDRAGQGGRPDLHRSRAACLDGKAQVEIRHLPTGPCIPAGAGDEGKTGIARGQFVATSWAETIYELEIRAGPGGRLQDHSGPELDLHNHYDEVEPTVPLDGAAYSLWAAVAYVAQLAAADEPQRASPHTPGPPMRSQRALGCRAAGEQHGTRSGGRRRRRKCQRPPPVRRHNRTTATTGHYQRSDHRGQAGRRGHRQPARRGRPEIPCGTLTDLVQPSHLTPRTPPSPPG